MLVALLALFYIFLEVRPITLQAFFQPLDQQLQRNFDALFPGHPEAFLWMRAGLYSAVVLGVFYALSLLVTRVVWFVPLLVLGGVGLLVYSNLLRLDQGALAVAIVAAIYLGMRLLERLSTPLAVVVGLVAAFRWADQGEIIEPGGLVLAVLILCFGGIVRLTRERRRKERNP
jgi:hypothetical protein